MTSAIAKFILENISARCFVAVVDDFALNQACLEYRAKIPDAYCGANFLYKRALVSAFEGLESLIDELEGRFARQRERHSVAFECATTEVVDDAGNLLLTIYHPSNPYPQE